MTIDSDSQDLLRFLAQLKQREDDPNEGRYQLSGAEILKWLPAMTAPRLNDAVEHLSQSSFLERRNALGTAPFSFLQIGLSTRGRHLVERSKSEHEAAAARTKVERTPLKSPWELEPPFGTGDRTSVDDFEKHVLDYFVAHPASTAVTFELPSEGSLKSRHLALAADELRDAGWRVKLNDRQTSLLVERTFGTQTTGSSSPSRSPSGTLPSMATGGWAPANFQEVVAELDASSMKIALGVKGTRTCPSPSWDPHRTYRVALVNKEPAVQRLVDGAWEAAPLEPPKGTGSMGKKPRTTETRLFISHAYADVALARELTQLVDGALSVPAKWLRCTSVEGYKLEPGADGPDELRANLEDSVVVLGLLTPASLKSNYVLMELGAAWGFKTWTVPLLGAGVDFPELPGPMARGIHAVKVGDQAGIWSLLHTISERCEMEWRAPPDRRHTLIEHFVKAATPVSP